MSNANHALSCLWFVHTEIQHSRDSSHKMRDPVGPVDSQAKDACRREGNGAQQYEGYLGFEVDREDTLLKGSECRSWQRNITDFCHDKRLVELCSQKC